MNGFGLLSFGLLGSGLLVIAASLNPALRIAICTRHRGWWTLLILMLFFVIGYILVIYYFASTRIDPVISLLIAGIMGGGGIFVGLVIQLSLSSITQAQAQTEREYYNARHDALTGLPNRTKHLEQLQTITQTAKRNNLSFAVIIADLDKFKEINDTLGHDMGDQLLQELGARLNKLRSDTVHIARLGGDEFAIIIHITSRSEAIHQAQQIAAVSKQAFLGEQYSLVVELSMGVAIYPEHNTQYETLMKYADIAMYNAKRNKRGIAVYNPEQDEHSLDQIKLLSQIQQALKQEEFQLFYQPLLHCKSKRIMGFEALIRWFKADGSIIMPSGFIPQIEQSQFMGTLSRWVIKSAIEQMAKWQRIQPSLKMSINLSAVDLQDENLVAYIYGCLKATSSSAQKLCFELTESAIMEDQQQAFSTIEALVKLGADIAIDDFGTGYSSLALLRDLPINIIKIDRSFVKDILSNPDNYAIVQAIIDIAHKTQRYVIAEGIDNTEIETTLRKLNCDIVQGFLYAKPISAKQCESWLLEHSGSPLNFITSPQNKGKLHVQSHHGRH